MLAETTLRNRQDLTKLLSVEQRRLDSLANLLAARSECVAVFILEGQICIAANEFFKGTQIENNKNYAAIKEIMDYFQRMAQNETIKSEERENIFVKICSTARFKESSPDGIAEDIARDVLDGKGLILTIDDIRNQYKENVAAASRMYGEFAKLRKDFLKLEQICSSPDSEFQSLRNILSQDLIILKEEDSPGIHAEVQLLAKAIKSNNFLNQKSKEIYIGISKLCCLHCRCMLETANKELGKKESIQIKFIFRGRHDLDFSANWSSPSVFEKGYNSVRENPRSTRHNVSAFDENALEFLIGKNSRILINELSKEMKPKGISMDASESSSEEGDKTGATIYQQKAFLERNLQLIISMETANLISAKEFILIALSMHDSNTFFQLCKIAKSIPYNEKTNYLITIMEELNQKILKKEEKITLDQIIKIMKNSNLVGEILADAYKEYVQPDLNKQIKEKNLETISKYFHEEDEEDDLTLSQKKSKDQKQSDEENKKQDERHGSDQSSESPSKKSKLQLRQGD